MFWENGDYGENGDTVKRGLHTLLHVCIELHVYPMTFQKGSNLGPFPQ